MLELRPNCELCDCDLPPTATHVAGLIAAALMVSGYWMHGEALTTPLRPPIRRRRRLFRRRACRFAIAAAAPATAGLSVCLCFI